MTEFKHNKLRDSSIKQNYEDALKDNEFKKLVSSLDVEEKELIYNTTKLQDTVSELNNCYNCSGLAACKNKCLGYVDYPNNYNGHIVFSYKPCQYQKQYEENKISEESLVREAQMKDIDLSDKKRIKLIKWCDSFIKSYDPAKENKGLYLHGSFGSGKTFIISAMLNELAKKRFTTEIVFFPTLLRDLKSDFDSLQDTINYLEKVDLLLIDDIGAEKVTEWSRDEILGTILQERMTNHKVTFLTSNFNIEELENHLSCKGEDVIKARRIIERIKQLTEDMELISINRRK